MIWQVVWIKEAEAELINLWIAGPDRASVTQAAEQIDEQLAINPVDFGESRQVDERIAFLGPLAVEFTIDLAMHQVFVFHIRRVLRRKKDL